MNQIIKTVDGARNILSDEIQKIRSGKTTPEKARAVSNMMSNMVRSIKIEIEYLKMRGIKRAIPFMEYKSAKKHG